MNNTKELLIKAMPDAIEKVESEESELELTKQFLDDVNLQPEFLATIAKLLTKKSISDGK